MLKPLVCMRREYREAERGLAPERGVAGTASGPPPRHATPGRARRATPAARQSEPSGFGLGEPPAIVGLTSRRGCRASSLGRSLDSPARGGMRPRLTHRHRAPPAIVTGGRVTRRLVARGRGSDAGSGGSTRGATDHAGTSSMRCQAKSTESPRASVNAGAPLTVSGDAATDTGRKATRRAVRRGTEAPARTPRRRPRHAWARRCRPVSASSAIITTSNAIAAVMHASG
eukprot:366195-Chlamydomonas_euryale.AAC.6